MDEKDILRTQMMSKSAAVAAILTFFFGGFGLLYVSIIVGLVASAIEIVLLLVVFFSAGLGSIIYVPWHLFCIILALVMVGSYNKRLLDRL